MGQLVNGVWCTDAQLAAMKEQGQPIPPDQKCEKMITADGSSGFKAEPNRYHLYVCYSCPFAERTFMMWKLKGLESAVSLSSSDIGDEQGWRFSERYPDPLYQLGHLHELYVKGDPTYTGKVTVPTLWDKKTGAVINNESSLIMRILDKEFKEFEKPGSLDYCPDNLRNEIDALNEKIHQTVNIKAYNVIFSANQQAYNANVTALFAAFDELNEKLGKSRFLFGEQPTESDFRLLATLVRFELVYYGLFKCNLKQMCDLPNLARLRKELMALPQMKQVFNPDMIKEGYYSNPKFLTPYASRKIIPLGPKIDFVS